jgi:hypothetical protein
MQAILQWFAIYGQPITQLVTIVGVPVAVVSYSRESRRQRDDRELGTYSSLDDKYIHYMNLCIAQPELNLFHVPLGRQNIVYTAEQIVQRQAMFEILISILERAFLMYSSHPTERRKNQWLGWEAYLHTWIGHPDFKALWMDLGDQFDSRFVAEVNRLANVPDATAG